MEGPAGREIVQQQRQRQGKNILSWGKGGRGGSQGKKSTALSQDGMHTGRAVYLRFVVLLSSSKSYFQAKRTIKVAHFWARPIFYPLPVKFVYENTKKNIFH